MQPRWSDNGKELFYVEGDRMMAATVSTADGFSADTPELLFQNPWIQKAYPRQPYDVSPAGQMFLLIEPVADEESNSIQVVQNWYEEFRDRE